jgi:phage tail protein X
MTEYTTIQGDTWDQIALKAYGSEMATRDMMAENGTRDPECLAVWRFAYGTSIRVPELTPDASVTDTLPEYRR